MTPTFWVELEMERLPWWVVSTLVDWVPRARASTGFQMTPREGNATCWTCSILDDLLQVSITTTFNAQGVYMPVDVHVWSKSDLNCGLKLINILIDAIYDIELI